MWWWQHEPDETFQDKIRLKKKPTLKEIVAYADIQNEICKKAHCSSQSMVRYSRYARKALILRKKQAELLETEKLIATLPAGSTKELPLSVRLMACVYGLTCSCQRISWPAW